MNTKSRCPDPLSNRKGLTTVICVVGGVGRGGVGVLALFKLLFANRKCQGGWVSGATKGSQRGSPGRISRRVSRVSFPEAHTHTHFVYVSVLNFRHRYANHWEIINRRVTEIMQMSKGEGDRGALPRREESEDVSEGLLCDCLK